LTAVVAAPEKLGLPPTTAIVSLFTKPVIDAVNAVNVRPLYTFVLPSAVTARCALATTSPTLAL
jgi:hypothetical protein